MNLFKSKKKQDESAPASAPATSPSRIANRTSSVNGQPRPGGVQQQQQQGQGQGQGGLSMTMNNGSNISNISNAGNLGNSSRNTSADPLQQQYYVPQQQQQQPYLQQQLHVPSSQDSDNLSINNGMSGMQQQMQQQQHTQMQQGSYGGSESMLTSQPIQYQYQQQPSEVYQQTYNGAQGMESGGYDGGYGPDNDLQQHMQQQQQHIYNQQMQSDNMGGNGQDAYYGQNNSAGGYDMSGQSGYDMNNPGGYDMGNQGGYDMNNSMGVLTSATLNLSGLSGNNNGINNNGGNSNNNSNNNNNNNNNNNSNNNNFLNGVDNSNGNMGNNNNNNNNNLAVNSSGNPSDLKPSGGSSINLNDNTYSNNNSGELTLSSDVRKLQDEVMSWKKSQESSQAKVNQLRQTLTQKSQENRELHASLTQVSQDRLMLQELVHKREKEMDDLRSKYLNDVRQIRATDDDHATIEQRIRMLQAAILQLTKSSSGDRAVNLNVEEAQSLVKKKYKFGNTQPYILNMFLEKYIMDTLLEEVFHVPFYVGFPLAKEYGDINKWMVENSFGDQAVRFRQQLCFISAKAPAAQVHAAQEAQRIAKGFETKLDRLYNNWTGHQKVLDLVTKAIELSLTMKSQNSEIAAQVIASETEFDAERMVPAHKSKEGGKVKVCVMPCFIDANGVILGKAKVFCG
ncbi:hypothetical protein BGZ98_000155 [Dissophora globulifera]|nr:hypothetical protein BGZ98_000155 [Dissophora globulifera]